MAELVVTNAFAYLGAHDFTGDINQWSMDGTAEAKKITTFRNNGANKYKMGLKTTVLTMSGNADMAVDGQDSHQWDAFNTKASRVVTIGNSEIEGQPCCMAQQLVTNVVPGGGVAVGEVGAFTLTGAGTDGVGGIRGVLLLEQTTVTTTGAKGTAVQHGAVSATQFAYGTLHLLGTAGTSITAVIESDDNADFSSATTRIAFGAQTAAAGYWGTPLAGAITDTYWRLRVTAITGTWLVGSAFGIQ